MKQGGYKYHDNKLSRDRNCLSWKSLASVTLGQGVLEEICIKLGKKQRKVATIL